MSFTSEVIERPLADDADLLRNVLMSDALTVAACLANAEAICGDVNSIAVRPGLLRLVVRGQLSGDVQAMAPTRALQ